MKNITYEDIMNAPNKEEAYQMINDEFASEELIDHLEKRFGKITDMFNINYTDHYVVDRLFKSRGKVKANDLTEFE